MYTAAIIGVSGFGAEHFKHLTQRFPKGTIKIVGATIINQDEEKAKCGYLRSIGCGIFSDYKEMLEKLNGKLDLCCIPTGTGMHKEMTISALKAGANVWVEKPLCPTIQEAREMKNAEVKSGKFVIVGYQFLAQQEIQTLKKILLSGQLGKVKCVKCMSPAMRDKSYYLRNNWAGKIRLQNGSWVLDSPFNNASAHQLNLILFLAGNSFDEPARLKNINAELYRARDYVENADTGFMRMETLDGKQLYYIASHSYDGQMYKLNIECEYGSVSVNDEKRGYEISYENGEKEYLSYAISSYAMTRSVYQKLKNPESFACNIDIAESQTIAMNGAHESSAIVKIPEEFTEIIGAGEEKEKTVIKGVEGIMLDCYKQAKLPSEFNVKWAKKGEIFDLCGYKDFNGGHR